jgi:membrane protease YdiL (CAAX protease family)
MTVHAGAAEPATPRAWFYAAAAVVYVFLALLIDTLIAQGVDRPFYWRALYKTIDGFELYKFIVWFVAPFLVSLPWMDWGWFGVKRWRRADWLLLGALAVICLGTILIIPLFPSLSATYSGVGSLPPRQKQAFLVHQVLWLASWLPGWEFLHRYFLLRPMMRVLPRFGWLVVPLSEGLYHLQKPPLEMAGMVLLSLVLTWWSMKRRNMLLPFLAHLAIELELIIFLVTVSM